MNRLVRYLIWLGCIAGLLFAGPVWADQPIVRAVLFYSPTCPHCHQVITQDLPPLVKKYGKQLEIAGIDTTQPSGQAWFQIALDRFNVPQEQRGVPLLIIGDVVLIGSVEIPDRLPGLIENYLAQGGVDWPDIPGFAEALMVVQPTPPPASSSPETDVLSVANVNLLDDLRARLARDPEGNALAIVVLMAMVFSVVRVALMSRRQHETEHSAARDWAILVLGLLGAGVAGYLAYVETAHVAAVCGPIGDCNTVQQSEYARLLGVIPIGVLGVIGYVAITIAGIIYWRGNDRRSQLAAAVLFSLTFFGTLFSIYLTFLEPFVIGATCAWCLASALIMMALLWLSYAPGIKAATKLLQRRNV